MNGIAFAVALEMLNVYEHTHSYTEQIAAVAKGIRLVLPGTEAEQLIGRILKDLGTELETPQAATPPAAVTA